MYNEESTEYNKGDIVMSTIYGRGVVIDIDDRFVTVAFARNFGVRKLMKNHKSLKKIQEIIYENKKVFHEKEPHILVLATDTWKTLPLE